MSGCGGIDIGGRKYVFGDKFVSDSARGQEIRHGPILSTFAVAELPSQTVTNFLDQFCIDRESLNMYYCDLKDSFQMESCGEDLSFN
jgi:hypothetical protein